MKKIIALTLMTACTVSAERNIANLGGQTPVTCIDIISEWGKFKSNTGSMVTCRDSSGTIWICAQTAEHECMAVPHAVHLWEEYLKPKETGG